MNTEAVQLAIPLIVKWEGFREKPYMCPAGKPTIGYGSTHYPNGVRVTMADPPCTKDDALNWAITAAGQIEDQIFGLVTRPISVHELGAMIALCYNIGVGVHDGIKGDFADSTLLADFNQGNFMAAANQFLLWNKIHFKGELVAMPGLTERRRDERALFLG